MVALPTQKPIEIRLLPQEQEGLCKFNGQFVATRNALDHFGLEPIVTALGMLRKKAEEGASLDYLQVFEIDGERLWIIDDVDAVTALRPEDY